MTEQERKEYVELKDVLIDTSQSCHTGSDFLTTHIYEYTKEYGFQIAA